MVTTDLWTVYVDGACNSKGSGAKTTIFSPIGGLIEKCIEIAFPATNNVAEYKALSLALRQLHSLEVKKGLLYNDSRLIVNQINNAFEAKRG